MSKNKQISSSGPSFIEVDQNHDGQRLDNFLFALLKGVPKGKVYQIIRKGEVRVNKGRAKPTTRLAKADIVRVPPIRVSDRNTKVEVGRYQNLKDATLFEDSALLVINKPSGMAVHAGSGIKVGIIEALRALRDDLDYLELAHRLDRETSGCLVLAKKASVLKKLNADFQQSSLKNSAIKKFYLSLLKGQWQHGERRVTKALNTQARRGGERHVVVDSEGSYASTIFKPISVNKQASFMQVKLLTGRTHQVRVHSLSEGQPIAGDQRYGDPDFNQQMRELGLKRLFLHSSCIQFTHPVSQQKLKIEAPLPAELSQLLGKLDLKNSK